MDDSLDQRRGLHIHKKEDLHSPNGRFCAPSAATGSIEMLRMGKIALR